ncbi:MAG: aminotransferase DegT [Clostridiales bacterium]|nr:aminotransferase DegT [Clostridiales bacterium]
MNKRIYLSSPHMGGKEKQYIEEAFATNWIAPLGKNVNEFEKEMCLYTGRQHALALSSGTAAIHLGLRYLGVQQGDIVFCQSFTFIASCNPAVYLGANLVFIDSEKESWNMCPKALKKAYEKYPNPKAIIVVNLYGMPADYDKVIAIAKQKGTPILEDAAESLGSTYKGVHTGNFGDISVFSFNGNKIITTSGGGMAMVNDEKAKNKMLFWATQARESFPWYQHQEIGYNYRLSNICAGIGRGQLAVLDKRVEQKRAIFDRYKEAFSTIDEIEMMPEAPFSCSNRWLSCMTLKSGCKVSAMDIINMLEKNNIEARPIWKPMHTQPCFKDNDFICVEPSGSVSEDIFSRGLCLPSDTKMTMQEQDYVIELIKEMF